ncbi:MAG: hypothetical protein ACSW8D_14015 [Prevotella sp.]
MEPNNQNFEPKGTKISPAMAVVWDAVCEALGTNTYDLIQQFIYAMIRVASEQHDKSPEIQRLLDALDLDIGWQNAINLCAPNGKLKIAQMVLIVEQEDKQGFGMVMLNKPYMGDVTQTENVNLIIERVLEVGLKKIYRKLRMIKADMRVNWLSDVLASMIDAQDLLNAEQADREELPGMGDHTVNGKRIIYGNKAKSKQHRTPDSLDADKRYQQTHIAFDDYDREIADMEAQDWEGEHRQTEEPPTNTSDHD